MGDISEMSLGDSLRPAIKDDSSYPYVVVQTTDSEVTLERISRAGATVITVDREDIKQIGDGEVEMHDSGNSAAIFYHHTDPIDPTAGTVFRDDEGEFYFRTEEYPNGGYDAKTRYVSTYGNLMVGVSLAYVTYKCLMGYWTPVEPAEAARNHPDLIETERGFSHYFGPEFGNAKDATVYASGFRSGAAADKQRRK